MTSAQKGAGGVGSKALIAATLAHFTNDGTSTMFTVLIVYYLSLPISLAYLGGAAAASNLVSGLVAERIGSWADNSGRRGMIMAAGIGLTGVATLIFAASFYTPQSAATTLLLGVMVLGIGLAFYHPLGGSIIAFASGTFEIEAGDFALHGADQTVIHRRGSGTPLVLASSVVQRCRWM